MFSIFNLSGKIDVQGGKKKVCGPRQQSGFLMWPPGKIIAHHWARLPMASRTTTNLNCKVKTINPATCSSRCSDCFSHVSLGVLASGS